ncbi:MAG: hypothetical protein COB92_07560 [Robiginitomaculum sp.]|nr:MAG: hypothetical protein COB92_07560 [Robiginitomaculum sp.]
MKPLYWKLLLILGAMVVGASLVVPKALRKNSHVQYESSAKSKLQSNARQGTENHNTPSVRFGFHQVAQTDAVVLKLCVEDNQCPLGKVAYPQKNGGGYMMVLDREIITSADLKSASEDLHPQNNYPIVNFKFNAKGARKFCDFTATHIGEPFAVVLDGEIITAPNINGAICGGSGFIENNFTMKEAKNIARALNAGTRPTKSRVID